MNKAAKPATFVMIHGAWHGAWCWQFVAPRLRQAGHEVYAPSLTGLAERRHLLSAQVSLHTHISDIVNLIEHNDLNNIVLVAHSYGGVVGANVAGRCLSRIKHLVWVDAHVPHSGESWGDLTPREVVQQRQDEANRLGLGIAIPVPDPAIWGLSGDLLKLAQARATPQPIGALLRSAKFDEVKVYGLPKTYISCEQPQLAAIDTSRQRAKAGQNAGSWHIKVMQTGHDPMLTQPQALADLLLDVAR
jgi:pimeloyl-ACP methyl ester carboxylesterase